MLIAKIKRFLGLGLLLILALGISANQLSAAEAAGGSGGGAGGGDGATALIMAAENGHVEAVRLLLAAGAHIDMQSPDGYTALILAAGNGHVEAVQLLLAAGANVDMQIPDGDTTFTTYPATALTLAAYNGRIDVIRLLLAAGANVNLQGSDGYTALIWAAHGGRIDVIRLLLAAGANVDMQGPEGYTALMMAAHGGHVEAVQLLLAAGANVDMQRSGGDTALMLAVYDGHADVIRLLLAAEANVNLQTQRGATALMAAAYNGNVEAVRLLLAAGAELPVGPAAGELSAEQNAMIQAALAELEARKVAFLAAAEAGNLAKINELIELPICDRRLVINQALLAVAQNSDLEMAQFGALVRRLIELGADINYAELITVGASESKDGGGAAEAPKELMTALDLAIQQNNLARVQFLIAHGANPLSLSNSTQERLAPFTLVTSKSDAGAYATELAKNRALKKIEMQDWGMPEADQERYLDQAFAIAQIIQDKIVEMSKELPKEDKERCLMAREDIDV